MSKATGVPLPKIAVGLMLGRKMADYAYLTGGQVRGVLPVSQCFVKSPVFPFNKFPGVDPALGPEMRSTGEGMGVGENVGEAFAKAQISAGSPLPDSGTLFFSVNDHHKAEAVAVARRFAAMGFSLIARRGTAAGLKCKTERRQGRGRSRGSAPPRPHPRLEPPADPRGETAAGVTGRVTAAITRSRVLMTSPSNSAYRIPIWKAIQTTRGRIASTGKSP